MITCADHVRRHFKTGAEILEMLGIDPTSEQSEDFYTVLASLVKLHEHYEISRLTSISIPAMAGDIWDWDTEYTAQDLSLSTLALQIGDAILIDNYFAVSGYMGHDNAVYGRGMCYRRTDIV